MEKLIANKSKKHLSAAKLQDEETERLLKLVKKKGSRARNVITLEKEEAEEGKVIDLVEVLKKSLSGKGK
ncbi:MAG TPA: hypothetical protein VJ124_16180 [Pyrinomonadaceae bacterium]|nr:hypothetical protein [Pyrinomonadaceae bacterium]